MKKIIFLLISLIPFGFYAGSIPIPLSLNASKMVPDVMGNICTMQYDGKNFVTKVLQVDSFPNFSGFPVSLSGVSSEGGIICNMNSDNNLEIIYNSNYTVNVIKMDGTPLTGWPKSVSPYPLQCAPAFGDIDGDGQGEVVATSSGLTSGGYIYAWHKDGSVVSGFPITHGYTTRTPVLGDIDNDGKMEIIVSLRGSSSGQEYVYRGNGTVYPGWPKPINHVPASSAAVGDIDGDGFPEIIAESYSSIFAWKANGDSIPGFPFILTGGEVLSYSSPVLADLNNDGKREIIFGTHNLTTGGGKVFVIDRNAAILPGWPYPVSHWIYGPPAVGLIDNDNILDIAVGDQILSSYPADYVYAWNKNGTPLSNFPIGPVNAVNDQVILADLNNDGSTDLMFDDNSTDGTGHGKYLAYKYDGTPLPGWPIQTTGTTFFQTPCLTDVNNDVILDILGGAQQGTSSTNLYLWNTGLPYVPSKIIIPMWQYNTRHNGVYGDVNPVGIKNHETKIPDKYNLSQNYPNPFNPSTVISYQLPLKSFVKIDVFDELGRLIQTLVNGDQNAGSYNLTWDGTNFSSGVYFYKLTAGGFSETRKMLLIK